MEKPDVDSIDGLSPAISIDQKANSEALNGWDNNGNQRLSRPLITVWNTLRGRSGVVGQIVDRSWGARRQRGSCYS